MARAQARGRAGQGVAHVPTDEQREAAGTLAAVGWTHADIAKLLGIAKNTLARHYATELGHGALAVHAQLARTAVQMALGGDRTMLIFCLKTRFGWSERPPAGDGAASDASKVIGGDTDPEVADRGEA